MSEGLFPTVKEYGINFDELDEQHLHWLVVGPFRCRGIDGHHCRHIIQRLEALGGKESVYLVPEGCPRMFLIDPEKEDVVTLAENLTETIESGEILNEAEFLREINEEVKERWLDEDLTSRIDWARGEANISFALSLTPPEGYYEAMGEHLYSSECGC